MRINWRVESKRIYVPIWDKQTKSYQSRPVDLRTLYLFDPRAITDSGHYKITFINRRSGARFGIHARPRYLQNIWLNPTVGQIGEPWYKIGDDYQKLDMLDGVPALKQWLGKRIGPIPACNVMLAFMGGA